MPASGQTQFQSLELHLPAFRRLLSTLLEKLRWTGVGAFSWSLLFAACNCGCCAIYLMEWLRSREALKPKPENSSTNCRTGSRMLLSSLGPATLFQTSHGREIWAGR